jgi:hypothetical protein
MQYMFRATIVLSSLATFIFLEGCTSMSLKECQSANWEQLGFQSALEGQPINEAASGYSEKCTQEHNVAVRLSDFTKGYDLGLKTYCTTQNGLKEGKGLTDYKGICPKELETNFLTGFNTGQIVGLKDEVQRLKSQVSSLESELSFKRNRISSLESEVSSLQSRTCNN